MSVTDAEQFVDRFYEEWGERTARALAVLEAPGTLGRVREDYDAFLSENFPAPAGVSFETVDAAGMAAEWATPQHVVPGRVLLYLHGGAYLVGGPRGYHGLVGAFARDLRARLLASGIDVPEEAIWTSALATAQFLDDQRPGGTAYVIGEAGLTTALHDIGYVLTDHAPDYVVLGETRTYSFEAMTKAVRLINGGARFICTNPDETGPSTEGPLPATGAVAALITKATGKQPYFAGKPNPLMMRTGLNAIGAHSETSAMIGDRMDTDVLAGLEAGMETFLVLTGLTTRADIDRHPFRPSNVVNSIADLVDRV